MLDDKIKVYVTGMGLLTALGGDLESVFASLQSGRTGITLVPSALSLRNENAAAINIIDTRNPKKRLTEITCSVIERAILDAGISDLSVFSRRFLIIGTSLGFRLDDDEHHEEELHQWVDEVARKFGLCGISLSTACSSGSDAILLGGHLIQNNEADLCICGGTDILGDSKRLAHSALGTLSLTTLKSFDETHDGTILGEAAGFVVIEPEKSSDFESGIQLIGWGAANDAAGLTAPDRQGNGIRLAIERAMLETGISIADISVINAHGSGTLTNDEIESAVYSELLKNSSTIISATKGNFGHSLGASGAIEAIILIKCLQEQIVPPVYGLANPIKSISTHLPVGTSRKINGNIGLSITIGFGGFNTCLIFSIKERLSK